MLPATPRGTSARTPPPTSVCSAAEASCFSFADSYCIARPYLQSACPVARPSPNRCLRVICDQFPDRLRRPQATALRPYFEIHCPLIALRVSFADDGAVALPTMRLSLLDQSPVISGLGARRAIEETLALARRVDELGYHRYRLAEHHAIAALADPCPELLLARLGAETQRIRIGTRGVLLPYYSAFRVAEAFRMLEALYPGRIDLGIGRAPGGDQRTAQAVAGGGLPDARQFPDQVWQLFAHLDGTLPDEHPFKRVRVQPEIDGAPEVWLLGSST